MSNFEEMSMFDMFSTEEIKSIEVSTPVKDTDTSKKDTPKSEEKKSTKKTEKKAADKKKTVDPNQKIEKDVQKYEKVRVKVYSDIVQEYEGEAIKTINLKNILEMIVQPLHPEFGPNTKWHMTSIPGNDKEALLIPLSPFHQKG